MRQRGMSSLALVLLILILGSLMLTGLNQQFDAFTAIVGSESQQIRRQAIVQSALEWGRVQSWQIQPDVQCKQDKQWKVCLRLFDVGRALLVAGSGDLLLWRGGVVQDGKVLFSPHGWSDFCPVKEGRLCQLP